MEKNAQKGNAPPLETVPTPTPKAAPTEQRFTRRIGTTTYRIAVHFSETSKETMNDKIMRMIKNETAGKVVNL